MPDQGQLSHRAAAPCRIQAAGGGIVEKSNRASKTGIETLLTTG